MRAELVAFVALLDRLDPDDIYRLWQSCKVEANRERSNGSRELAQAWDSLALVLDARYAQVAA